MSPDGSQNPIQATSSPERLAVLEAMKRVEAAIESVAGDHSCVFVFPGNPPVYLGLFLLYHRSGCNFLQYSPDQIRLGTNWVLNPCGVSSK